MMEFVSLVISRALRVSAVAAGACAVGLVLAGTSSVSAGGAGAQAQGAQAPARGQGAPQEQTAQPAPGRQGQPAPAPSGRQGQAGGRGGPDTRGPVRDASGAVIGYTNLAEIPGTPWRIHDAARPHPPIVAPGAAPGAPPADAIVLFNGKDLSQWAHMRNGQPQPAEWPVRDGYFETGAGSGSIVTREAFGDVQLHLEFATPASGEGASQGRGNSGVILMGRYEVQVLDSYQNVTYADGQAAAIYGEYPPLVNVARRPGEWQTYDIIFEAPRFSASNALVRPAYITVLWNGVLVHHRRAVMGSTGATATPHTYTPHPAELPLTLQDHSNPVRYRNVWIRRLASGDQAAR